MEGKLAIISGVLQTKRYAAIGASSGTGLGIIYYFLTMSMLPLHFEAVADISPHYVTASVGLTAVVSGLAGVNFAMMAFKIKRTRLASARSDSSAILGGAFAAFTPGCPACTAPLAVILGAVGGLSLFPMQGLELKMISAGVLLFSVYWIARSLQSKSCCSMK
ncbi:MAG: hypothetical protein EB829_05420 [Nitrosopumilus sp. H8]|nr:MAG: hypothetical protein EB829_05420 [Nitrosopumilus sp. H8]